MEKILNRQVQKSIEFGELYDQLMKIAKRYDLNHEVLNILIGRLKKKPDHSDDQTLFDELKKLYATMQELNEHGAQKNLDPTTIKSAELLAKRQNAIRKFEKLDRDIQTESKRLGNIAGLSSCETARERNARWLDVVPSIMKEQKCSESVAISQLAKTDHSLGRQVPRDPKRTYYQAKALSNRISK